MLGKEILKRLSEILGKPIGEVENLIRDIKERFGVSDDIAILEVISRYNIADEAIEIVKLIKLRQTLIQIKRIKSGMRNISVVGVVETIRFFNRGKYIALILLTDNTGTAQVYVSKNIPDRQTLSKINVGSVVSLENVVCLGILSNSQPKLILTKYSSIHVIDKKLVEEFLNTKIPNVRLYDIRDIAFGHPSEDAYFHISAVYMGEKQKSESLASGKVILLGSINDFCRTKIQCILRENAIHEFKKIDAKPGDIIIAHCVLIREFKNVRYIVARNLTIFHKKDPELTPPNVVGTGGWWKYNIIIQKPPRFGTYEKNGEINRYATLTGILPDGTKTRLLVWNEALLDLISDLKPGTELAVFGVVEITNQIKIHVHRRLGFIEVIGKKHIPTTTIRTHQLITSFQDLRPNTNVDILCKIVALETIKSEKLYGVLRLYDGNKTIRMLVWDAETFKQAEECSDSLVKITSIRVRRDRTRKQDLILLSTKFTTFKLIAKFFDYDTMESYKPIRKIKSLDSLSLGELAYVSGTITKVEWIGKMYFCKKCGSLIVDLEKKVCELGHIGYVDEKTVISATIDDGFSERSVIIPLAELRKLGIIREGDIQAVTQRLIGKEMCLFGKLKIELSMSTPTKFFLGDKIYNIVGVEAFYERFFRNNKHTR